MMSSRKKNIVVIDDDQSFIFTVKKAVELYDKDAVIHSANDIESGFNLALEVSADLFILDIQLPKSSGLNFSNAIDELDKRNVPTIFVSGDYKYKKVVDEMKVNKEVWFVKKPLDIQKFGVILDECFSHEIIPAKPRKVGLLKRPRPIVAIGVFHLLEPIFKIIYLKISTGFSMKLVLSTIFSLDTMKSFIDFWLIFPLAGILLLSFRKIPYFLFLLMQAYIIYLHFSYESFTWPYVNEQPLLFSSALVSINIFLIIYLFLPKVRRPFFDKSIKWWAAPKRHRITIPCLLEFGDQLIEGNTINISRTGIFFETDVKIPIKETVKIRFQQQYFNSVFRATVIHSGEINGAKGVGIRFHLLQFGDHYEVIKFMSALKKLEL